MELTWAPERIAPALASGSKWEVLEELAGLAAATVPGLKFQEVLQALTEREKLGSTARGQGFAIPHCRIRTLKEPVLLFGKSQDGVAFDSLDGRPVHLFFVLLLSEQSADADPYLVQLGRLTRFANQPATRLRLMNAMERQSLLSVLSEM